MWYSKATYLVGDMFTIKNDKDETSVNGWSADGMVGFSHSGTDVYEDSKFSIVFTTTADNQCWKIIPKTNTEGEFWGAGVLGTVTDGDTATEGTLTTNNPQAGMITQAGMYRNDIGYDGIHLHTGRAGVRSLHL